MATAEQAERPSRETVVAVIIANIRQYYGTHHPPLHPMTVETRIAQARLFLEAASFWELIDYASVPQNQMPVLLRRIAASDKLRRKAGTMGMVFDSVAKKGGPGGPGGPGSPGGPGGPGGAGGPGGPGGAGGAGGLVTLRSGHRHWKF